MRKCLISWGFIAVVSSLFEYGYVVQRHGSYILTHYNIWTSKFTYLMANKNA